MDRRTPAHRAGAQGVAAVRSGSPVRTMLAGSAALVAVLALSLSAVGGTYAMLSSSQQVALVSSTGATSTTITAGTAAIAANGDTIQMTALYPGASRTAEFAVSNTGDTALAVSVDSISGLTAANGLTASVAGASCTAGAPSVASGPLSLTVPAKATATLCLTVAMSTAAPSTAQGLSSGLVVALTGTQP